MSVTRTIVEHVLEHVIDGALVAEPDGTVLFANGDTERIFARQRAEIVHAALDDLFEELPADWKLPGTRTLTARRSDGSRLEVRATITQLDDSFALTMQDRASANPLPAMPDPAGDPDEMLVTIADAVDAFLYAGEMDVESGWYLPIFHGPGMQRLLGADVSYEDANRIFDTRVYPEDYPAYEALYDVAHRTDGVPLEATYRLRGLDGRLRWLRERSVPRFVGDRWLLLGVIFDVTAEVERAAEVERERTERLAAVSRFERVVSLSADLVIALDAGGVIRYANPATRTLLGCEPSDLVGGSWDRLAHARDAAEARHAVAAEFGERSVGPRVARTVGPDAEMLYLSWTGAFDPVEGLMYYVGRDITVEVEARAAVEERARIDALTGLSNRRHVVEVLTAELERARRERGRPGVLIVDVDHFKSVNDVYGHAAGDSVLVEVANRLRRAVRRYDVVGRWGGEEFCVVVPGITDEKALRRAGETIRSLLAEAPIALGDGRLVQLTASIGAVVVEEGIWSVEALVDAADRALYAAKRRGRNRLMVASDLELEDFATDEPEALRLAEALALSASAREGMPDSHPREVAELSAAVATRLGLPDDAVLRCRIGGWLHDLGKVGVPDRVLGKSGPLDDHEWALMRAHAEVGEGVVRRIPGLALAAPIVRHHHERWDGTGYPDELAAEDIPLEARVVAVADAYSALTHDRVYRGARRAEQALADVVAASGVQFDPACVDALVAVLAGDVVAPARPTAPGSRATLARD